MRMILILAVAVLVTVGCNNNDTEVTPTLPESKASSEMTESKIGGLTGESTIDPVFKDYEYPGSKFDGMFSMGNVVSVSYRSTDDFSKVVEFYKQKFSGAKLMTGTSAHFVKQTPDGSSLTVTVTPINDITQIILKLNKER